MPPPRKSSLSRHSGEENVQRHSSPQPWSQRRHSQHAYRNVPPATAADPSPPRVPQAFLRREKTHLSARCLGPPKRRLRSYSNPHTCRVALAEARRESRKSRCRPSSPSGRRSAALVRPPGAGWWRIPSDSCSRCSAQSYIQAPAIDQCPRTGIRGCSGIPHPSGLPAQAGAPSAWDTRWAASVCHS